MTYLSSFFHNFINVFVESAPWLILGYVIAGLIKVLIPTHFLNKHLGQSNYIAVIKGALFGAPLPLCSCGVIPAALGLRRAGASKAATTSFLIATPETGVDSVLVTHALLGPFMAIIRPIAAVTTAICAGLTVLLLTSNDTITEQQTDTVKSCCSSKKETIITPQADTANNPLTQALSVKIKSALSFSFIDLVKDTALWLLIGLFLAALITTIIPPAFMEQWGATPYAYFLMAAIGVPMYICATASTPIAAGFLFAGVSPGAILVFLLVGPATNIATLAIVKNELGKKVLAIYLIVIVLLSFVFGVITDTMSKYFSFSVNYLPEHNHQSNIIGIVSGLILAALIINALNSKYGSTFGTKKTAN